VSEPSTSAGFAPVRSISVLMPTWQGEEFLEVLVIDSRSTDRTLSILGSRAASFPVPLRVRGIHQVEFDHGDTRNLLAAWSEGDLLVYLTQDAIPAGPDWLADLARNFEDPLVAAATCRNVPRPDADVLTKLFSADDPGYAEGRRETRLPPAAEYDQHTPHAKRLLFGFNDVASAVRRAAWRRHPFPRTWFGEDVLMARGLLEAGWTVVYDDRAVVEHSHDYDAAETRARAVVDGRFNAEWLDRLAVASSSDARALTERFARSDRDALAALGHEGDELDALCARARELRAAAFEGLCEGGRTERREPGTAALEREHLKVLYVVHGFPPDTWAGTEVYTLGLAKQMQRLGHEVVVLARVPAPEGEGEGEGAPADFTVTEDEFEGLRVLRCVHRLAHANLRESFHQPRAEAAFRGVLSKERPDLVHFQHLIHWSAGLVHVARELGLPTMLHCHDYWALCARVQLIRPDGERCEENMGAGCLLCVKEQRLEDVPRLARLGDGAVGGLVDGALAVVGALGSSKLRAQAGAWRDMRDRHAFVTSAYAAADLRVSPSRFLRDVHVDTAGFDPHTFLFSDNGMRTDHVAALAKEPDPEGRVRFGFVGSLVWYKGGRVMVEAMRRLCEQRGADVPAVLNVYGDWRPEEDAHHAELAELAADCGDHVRFLGRFDNARLSEVHAEIDALLVPSVWFENSPITIHEAFLTRTPILASDLGGMAEYVRDGVDGLLFGVGDADDLARRMGELVDDRELLTRLGSTPPPVKTLEENALETEFRYRALACRSRARRSAALLDLAGIDTLSVMGTANQQGAGMLLLRPDERGGAAAAEYDVAPAAGGVRTVRVDVVSLGGEDQVELAGRVLVDGVELGRLGPLRAGGRDETHSHLLRAVLPEGARRLRIEARASAGAPAAHLRIARVLVGDEGAEGLRA
jgi:glycosyltransferase involved in cell wall biosynthesis